MHKIIMQRESTGDRLYSAQLDIVSSTEIAPEDRIRAVVKLEKAIMAFTRAEARAMHLLETIEQDARNGTIY